MDVSDAVLAQIGEIAVGVPGAPGVSSERVGRPETEYEPTTRRFIPCCEDSGEFECRGDCRGVVGHSFVPGVDVITDDEVAVALSAVECSDRTGESEHVSRHRGLHCGLDRTSVEHTPESLTGRLRNLEYWKVGNISGLFHAWCPPDGRDNHLVKVALCRRLEDGCCRACCFETSYIIGPWQALRKDNLTFKITTG
jgi:hypothetical protein